MDYFEWVKMYPDYVIIEKEGIICKATGNSAYVLNDLLNYPLSTGEYGHVIARGDNLDEIEACLIQNHINFIVIENGIISAKKCFDDSSYSPYTISNYIKQPEKSVLFENKGSADDELSLLLGRLVGKKVVHRSSTLGEGVITKAVFSEDKKLYVDIKFDKTGESKQFIFIYCMENSLLTLLDDNGLYKKIKYACEKRERK